ncbi:MAG: flagellar FlbD family protein [Oscillospiraceae bacterium]|nr:flagellar FlbD family protein [Oscillospiraceae bacterium]
MILVTRLNRVEQFYVNEELIEFIEETPDTVISLDSGKKIVVLESAETVIERLRAEKIKVLRGRDTGDFYRSSPDAE